VCPGQVNSSELPIFAPTWYLCVAYMILSIMYHSFLMQYSLPGFSSGSTHIVLCEVRIE